MDKEEQLWERLAPIVLEREHGFGDITVGRATDQQGKDNLLNFIFQELDKAREEGYVQGLKDLHNSDIYQDAVCSFGEWSQEGMDRGFEEAKKDLLSKLTTK